MLTTTLTFLPYLFCATLALTSSYFPRSWPEDWPRRSGQNFVLNDQPASALPKPIVIENMSPVISMINTKRPIKNAPPKKPSVSSYSHIPIAMEIKTNVTSTNRVVIRCYHKRFFINHHRDIDKTSCCGEKPYNFEKQKCVDNKFLAPIDDKFFSPQSNQLNDEMKEQKLAVTSGWLLLQCAKSENKVEVNVKTAMLLACCHGRFIEKGADCLGPKTPPMFIAFKWSPVQSQFRSLP